MSLDPHVVWRAYNTFWKRKKKLFRKTLIKFNDKYRFRAKLNEKIENKFNSKEPILLSISLTFPTTIPPK